MVSSMNAVISTIEIMPKYCEVQSLLASADEWRTGQARTFAAATCAQLG
jgi:hypothetical protein